MEGIVSDLQAMHMAIAQAKRGLGFVSPNPVVGCVILDRDGRLIGQGFHAKAGTDHAEVAALKSVADAKKLEGARVFVTLEPCSHYGRTPPCAKTLSELPIAEVIFGLQDPNPQVAGKGLEQLRAAGKTVRTLPELHQQLEELAEIFLWNMRRQSTFFALKVATSLDGKSAFQNGESQWITHESARLRARELRGFYDAVLVGERTFTHDQPRLDLRHPRFENKKQNAVIILDPDGRTLQNLEKTPAAQVRGGVDKIWTVVKSAKGLRTANPVLECPTTSDGQFDLHQLGKLLLAAGIHSVFAEGGADTLSQFLSQRCAQRLYQFISATLLGNSMAVTWTNSVKIAAMDQRLNLINPQWEVVGPDILLSARLPVSN